MIKISKTKKNKKRTIGNDKHGKKKNSTQYIIEQETQQLKEEIKEKDEKLTNLISEIKNYYSKKGQIPKEILSALLKIWKKHNFPPYKTKHLQPTFFKHKPKLK